ncbi:MAG: polymer-forming cytoskeletal protein [Deltaproteobacteria bacterium]|jgi:cytoskeletal protein CcmA (bactofilin family)|nr:polymer-forming cytoskeletal protein [Deltaproteobacteria bacterium]MCK5010280.1 polymer-forming cytoskeletal protein [Deltaproteobacteria bacterium]MCK5186672.1 polymer-forming cytoskeletal protein [Deltaproteobacteria bacterium]MCK5256465.1 polymer-forming cytoskeletal protein [Deltaproteobacteria bacterium]MCK5513561.1 polymer-forming cytoskeletal protein [Deltaproteobacteria bacterium]
MGILKKDKAPDNLDTLIGSKTIFEGVLISNESICIEGTVKGKVECRGNVVVGKEGKVKADIIAENAFIGGQVNGNIKAKKRLEITSTGRVKGDIETSSLIIADGVLFEGSCHMVSSNKSVTSSSPAEEKNMLKQSSQIEKAPLKPQTSEAGSQ